MGGESRYEIHQNAYMKLVLHAVKHRNSAVNGVLLGRSSADGDSVEIVDSVPLFHSQIGLLPPLEIALIMVFHQSTLNTLHLFIFFPLILIYIFS